MMNKTSLTLALSFMVTTLLIFQNCSDAFFIDASGNLSRASSNGVTTTSMECAKSATAKSRSVCLEVGAVYVSLLKREASISDLNYWTKRLQAGSGTIGDVRSAVASTTEAMHVAEMTRSVTRRSVLWGAFTGGIPAPAGGAAQTHDSFNAQSGKKASLAGFGTWWFDTNSDLDFKSIMTGWMDSTSASGATPILLWNASNPLTQPACSSSEYDAWVKRYTSRTIASGVHDAYIRKFAQQVRAWGKPMYMRTMHELNNIRVVTNPCTDYFNPWDAEITYKGEKINSRADVINAFRRMVTIFREEGATNAQWIWSVLSHPSADFGGTNAVSLASIYPGDAYVNWIGVECYNFDGHDWLGCADRMRGTYNEAAAMSTRPIINIEMGAVADARKDEWMWNTFNVSSSQSIVNNFPRLTGVMYWEDGREDSYPALWIKSDAGSVDAFRRSIASEVYVAGGPSGPQSASCVVDGVTVMSATSKTMYRSLASANCAQESQTRTCTNGMMSGDASYSYSVCKQAVNNAEAQDMVTRVMINVLGRTASEVADDSAGVAFWVTQVISQGRTEAQLASALLATDEYFLRQLYLTYYRQSIDSPGLRYWVDQLASGAKTRPQVEADIKFAASTATAAPAPTPRPNATEASTPVPTPAPTPVPDSAMSQASARAMVIGLMINVMGRIQSEIDQDPSGLATFTQRIMNGESAASIEAYFRASDEFFVRRAYETELRRRADFGGVQFFVSELTAGRTTRAKVLADMRFNCANHVGGECR